MTDETEDKPKDKLFSQKPKSAPEKVAEAATKLEKENYYTKKEWAPGTFTFCCQNCGHYDASEDGMKLHVLTHVPEKERNELLDKLTKE